MFSRTNVDPDKATYAAFSSHSTHSLRVSTNNWVPPQHWTLAPPCTDSLQQRQTHPRGAAGDASSTEQSDIKGKSLAFNNILLVCVDTNASEQACKVMQDRARTDALPTNLYVCSKLASLSVETRHLGLAQQIWQAVKHNHFEEDWRTYLNTCKSLAMAFAKHEKTRLISEIFTWLSQQGVLDNRFLNQLIINRCCEKYCFDEATIILAALNLNCIKDASTYQLYSFHEGVVKRAIRAERIDAAVQIFSTMPPDGLSSRFATNILGRLLPYCVELGYSGKHSLRWSSTAILSRIPEGTESPLYQMLLPSAVHAKSVAAEKALEQAKNSVWVMNSQRRVKK